MPDTMLSAVLAPTDHPPAVWAAVLVALGSAAVAWWRSSGGSERSRAQQAQLQRPLPRRPSANRLGPAAEWIAGIEQHSQLVMDAEMLVESSHPILEDGALY